MANGCSAIEGVLDRVGIPKNALAILQVGNAVHAPPWTKAGRKWPIVTREADLCPGIGRLPAREICDRGAGLRHFGLFADSPPLRLWDSLARLLHLEGLA